MIIDFPKIKENLHKGMEIFLRQEINRKAPFAATIGKHFFHEGDKSSYETVDREKKALDFKRGESQFTVTRDEMNKLTIKDIIQKVQGIAEDMAGQIERNLFQTMNETIEKSGNTIPGNPPFSPEAFLKGLEMVEIDFDEDDRNKPQLPTLVMHPDLAKKAKEQEANMTAEEKKAFDEKMKAMIDKKYDDFLTREAKRKLVD
ncbi:MAG: hypothetical protein HYY86_02855 [Candidatus Harrisonbacteria bacterium]|nr:hypothetical protein [Candidatus Harrisonbacteria bacterium]